MMGRQGPTGLQELPGAEGQARGGAWRGPGVG